MTSCLWTIAALVVAVEALLPFQSCCLADTRSAVISESDRQRVRELTRRAVELIDRHDFPAAELTLQRALAIVPKNTTCLFNLACVHAAEHRSETAMDDLERATDAGFTDLSRIENEPVFADVRTLRRCRELLARRKQITHHAAELIMGELRQTLGEKYLIDADEQRKLVLAARLDQNELDALAKSLRSQAMSLTGLIFSHPSDEFIRIIVASPADFARLERRSGVGGRYDDATRTVLVKSTGAEFRHEFTHALHAADQHALDQEHPVWLSEGLATLYENPRIESMPGGEEDRVLPADRGRLPIVQAAARRDALIPLSQLLQMKRAGFTARADLAYGESGSLLMYLYERQQLKEFYRAYTSNFGSDPTGREELEKVAGMKLDALQRAWTEWLLARG